MRPLIPSDSKLTSSIALSDEHALCRRELFLWLAAVLLANHLFRVHEETATELLDAFLAALASRSVFYYLAWSAVFTLLWESKPRSAAQRIDFSFAISICLVNFLPAYSALWFSTTAAAAYIWARSAGDDAARAAAAVIMAISLNGYWGPLAFESFAPHILRVDAALVGTLLSSFGQSYIQWQETVVGTPGGHSIIVFGPCSSFHNISLGLLCWITVTKLTRTNWQAGDIPIALLVCVTVIVLNVSRLSILALNVGDFEYWHVGFGAELFNWATTFTVLVISLWGALRTPKSV